MPNTSDILTVSLSLSSHTSFLSHFSKLSFTFSMTQSPRGQRPEIIKLQNSLKPLLFNLIPFYLFPSKKQNHKQLMKVPSSMLIIIFLSLLPLLLQPSHSATILVDGVSEWKNPTVHIGDSIGKY